MSSGICPKCNGSCHQIDDDETEWECEDCGFQFQGKINEDNDE